MLFRSDVAAMALDNPIDGSQPQSGSFTELLGGEKGLENLLHGSLVHAMTSIGDGQKHVFAGLSTQVAACQ